MRPEDIAEVERIMKLSDEELKAELTKDGKSLESVAASKQMSRRIETIADIIREMEALIAEQEQKTPHRDIRYGIAIVAVAAVAAVVALLICIGIRS